MEGISIRPFLYKNKKDPTGKCPISICITINRKRTYRFTGFKAIPKQWDDTKKVLKKSAPNASLINQSIANKISEIEAELIQSELQGKTISIESLKKNRSVIVAEYIEQAIADMKGKWSEGRIKHFKTEKDRLHEFSPGIRFDQIDNSFLKRYELFLRTPKYSNHKETKDLKRNTIHSIWKRLIRIFNLAIKDGTTKNYPFRQYDNPKYKQTIRTFLLSEEVEEIEKLLKLPLSENQVIVVNYFLLGCYSGLRYSDWARFNYDGFVQKDRIILGTKKTGEIISLQMHKRLKAVVERLKDLPPIISADKTRDYLTGIAKMAKIQKHITTHVARHSFAVRCAEMDIPPVVTAELMGITVREVMVYYQLTNRKIDAEFSKWDSY